MYSDDLIENTAVILKRGNMTRSAFGVLRAYVRHKVAEVAVHAPAVAACVRAFLRALVQHVAGEKLPFGAVVRE